MSAHLTEGASAAINGPADLHAYIVQLTSDLVQARTDLLQQATAVRASGARIDSLSRDLNAAQTALMKAIKESREHQRTIEMLRKRLTRLQPKRRKGKK